MRTKIFLLTAAVGAVGLATSFAQVYSVNAVGYVNLTIPSDGAKLAMIANPLNGTNNELNTILPLPDDADGSVIYVFDVASQSYQSANFFAGFGWAPNLTINPGEGFFIQAASVSGSPNLTITFVGDVPQGLLVNNLAPAPRLSLRSSIVPQAAPLGDEATPNTLNFPAEDGDVIYAWDQAAQTYVSYNYFEGFGWAGSPDPTGPVIKVAEGFFVQKNAGNTKTAWTRNFSVN